MSPLSPSPSLLPLQPLPFTPSPSLPIPSLSPSLQMYAGQSSIEKTLAITQAIRDSQLRAIQNYHKQTFLPAAAAVATILTEQASALTSMGVELITKVGMEWLCLSFLLTLFSFSCLPSSILTLLAYFIYPPCLFPSLCITPFPSPLFLLQYLLSLPSLMFTA